LPPQPQLSPFPQPLPFPQQQHRTSTMMMIHQRQEQLLPELKHMYVTSLAAL
jgi:hypothetical protein